MLKTSRSPLLLFAAIAVAGALALPAIAVAEELEPPSAERGAELWGKCQACHTIDPQGHTLVGPPLYGVFGRAAGAVPGYRYSEALRKSGIVWTDDSLNSYLAATQDFVPGSRMYGGLAIAQDRADLLAWMHKVLGR
jgi:cytochrome c